MAIPSKPPSTATLQSANELPDFKPRLPGAVIERFPELRAYEDQQVKFHETVKKVLVRLLDELNRSDLARSAEIESLETTIASLQSEVDGIEIPEAATATEASSDDSALADHIAATSAHGVVGNVVGTTDEQPLDSKTIGFTKPAQGRFLASPVAHFVAGGQEVRIPEGYSMVIAGGYQIFGTLVVEGSLAIV